MSILIKKLHWCTQLEVWKPKYNDQSLTQSYDEPVALVHKRKIDFAAPVIIITFPKAKHLQGQRFAIHKQYAQSHAVGSNGRAEMYEIPLSHFEPWETHEELYNTAMRVFDD